MTRARAFLAALLAMAVLCQAPAGASAPPQVSPAGPKVDDFALTDQTLMARQLSYYRAAPAIVLMTYAVGSRASQDAAVQLQALDAAFRRKGAVFLMINAEGGDVRAQVQAEARARNITLPILIDEQQLVGEGLGLSREGEVLVIEPKTMT